MPSNKRLSSKTSRKLNQADITQESSHSAMSLRQLFDDYISTRKLKPTTLKGYKLMCKNGLHDWLDLPITAITKQMVVEKHRALSETYPATANSVMRVLRALLSYAECIYEDERGNPILQSNPVKLLSRIRGWNRVKRRTGVIAPHQMPSWFAAVNSINNKTASDFLKFTLFTGLRLNEAASLSWTNVDFKAMTITISDTKNHEIHLLPLSDYLQDLLIKRWHERTSDLYVFPGSGNTGHLTDVRDVRRRISERSGVKFTVHDLRRTFASCADSLELSSYAVKRLLNHKSANDVTAGYIISDVERLRGAMQQITDKLLELALNPVSKKQIDLLSTDEISDGNGKKVRIRMPVSYAHHFISKTSVKIHQEDLSYLRWLSSFPLKPIKTAIQYEFAKQVFQQFASTQNLKNTQGVYLDALLALITDYEHQKLLHRMKLSPQDALRDVMKEKGIKQHDLTKILLHKSTVSEFLSGKHLLRTPNAIKLAESLGVEPELFMPRNT